MHVFILEFGVGVILMVLETQGHVERAYEGKERVTLFNILVVVNDPFTEDLLTVIWQESQVFSKIHYGSNQLKCPHLARLFGKLYILNILLRQILLQNAKKRYILCKFLLDYHKTDDFECSSLILVAGSPQALFQVTHHQVRV